MNASFFFLILSLLFLGYMTDWNKHVLFLMLVSTGLWMTMIWYVLVMIGPSRCHDAHVVVWDVGLYKKSRECNIPNKMRLPLQRSLQHWKAK